MKLAVLVGLGLVGAVALYVKWMRYDEPTWAEYVERLDAQLPVEQRDRRRAA